MEESWSSQQGFDVRFEWGDHGVRALAPHVRVMVIVDVLRFTTAVDAAVSRGAVVYPYAGDRCGDHARSLGAIPADGSSSEGYSLSPGTLRGLRDRDAIVLPSPNGSACTVTAASAGVETVVAACLRNARAAAEWVGSRRGPYAVVACGERWPDGSLRPALEDALAAGAVVNALKGRRSPEAAAVAAAWVACGDDPAHLVTHTASGRELTQRGGADDVTFAAEIDVSSTVPVLIDGAYRKAPPG